MITPVKFFSEVKQEGRKVTWPSRKEVLASSGIVIVMAIICALFFLFADWVISSLIQLFLGM